MAEGVRTLDRRAYGRPGAPAREGRARDEQILPDREQRDLDAVPSFLALCGEATLAPFASQARLKSGFCGGSAAPSFLLTRLVSDDAIPERLIRAYVRDAGHSYARSRSAIEVDVVSVT